MIQNAYGGWNKDLNGDMTVASYFDSLPLLVKEEINKHAAEIHSFDDMRRFADHIACKLD